MQKNGDWERELTEFIENDIDGRFWFDDMVGKMLDGRMTVQSYEDHLRHESEEVDEDSFEAGREVGYDDGYEQGYEMAQDESYVEGYNEGYDHAKANLPRAF